MSRIKAIGMGLLVLIAICCICIGGANLADSLGLLKEPSLSVTEFSTLTPQENIEENTPTPILSSTQQPTNASNPEPSKTIQPTDLPTFTPSPTRNKILMPFVPNYTIPNIQAADCVPKNTLTQKGIVVEVIDGDTIKVQLEDGQVFRVRYIGMDTPESTNQVELCGPEASYLNRTMVEGKPVLLVMDVSEVDKYDRLLRYVLVGEIFVNYELVIQGYGQQVSYPPDIACVDTFKDAQRIARENGRGCWATTPTYTAAPTKPSTPIPTKQIPPPPPPPPENSECHPSYPSVCLKMNAGDYDCAGGSGNGPNYVQGPIKVLPPDPFDLDRDGDEIGCE